MKYWKGVSEVYMLFIFIFVVALFAGGIYIFNNSGLKMSSPQGVSGLPGASGESYVQKCSQVGATSVSTYLVDSNTGQEKKGSGGFFSAHCNDSFLISSVKIPNTKTGRIYLLDYDLIVPVCNLSTGEVYWTQTCGDNQVCTNLGTPTKPKYQCVDLKCTNYPASANLSVNIAGKDGQLFASDSQRCGFTTNVDFFNMKKTYHSHVDSLCVNLTFSSHGHDRTFTFPSAKLVTCSSSEICVPYYAVYGGTSMVPGYCVPRPTASR